MRLKTHHEDTEATETSPCSQCLCGETQVTVCLVWRQAIHRGATINHRGAEITEINRTCARLRAIFFLTRRREGREEKSLSLDFLDLQRSYVHLLSHPAFHFGL